jgi:NAD dependent epimerase/dehydratase family enzyme
VKAEDSGFTNRIHADDLSAFCLEALTKDIDSGIYNCCDGQPSTMNDYFIKVADALKLSRPKEISLLQARQELSSGMLSYLAESKRISNKKLLNNFMTRFKYPDLDAGLQALNKK